MTHYSRSNGVLSSILDRSLLPSPQAYYSQYFTLKGSKPFVCCPFHHEKTASFQIYLDTGSFFCHGCGEHGDMIAYHMKKHGYTFVEAVKDLGANIAPIANETTQAKAARLAKQVEAERQYQERKQQADKEVLAEAQAFIPTVTDILQNRANSLSIPPYIEAKGVIMDSLQAMEASKLEHIKHPLKEKTLGMGLRGVLTVIPLHTMQGELVALQVINGEPDEKGKYSRRFIGKPSTLKAFFFIGDFTASDVVLICEGVADALSLFEATGYPVLCALSAGRLTEAAQAARKAYPQAKIILCADNDKTGQQAALTAAQAVNGYLALPQSPHKDFNDIHRLEGLAKVNAIIQESTAAVVAVVAVVAEETAKNTQTDPDLINKTIEALPTPEERNKARALQSAMQTIAPQDAMEGSFSTGERVIGFGLSYEYKQAQDSIGALLATDWDGKTGGNSLSHYMGADLEHPNPIKIASIYGLAVSKGWERPADEWQDPESITAHYEAEDYPLDQLPEPLRLAVIAVTNYLQCPLAMVANSLLGALALSIQGLVNVARDSQLVSVSSLFLLLIGESGERKSACDKMLTQHLNELDLERFKADNEARKEYAKELKIWQAKLSGAENALKRDSEKGLPTQEIEQRINALYLEEPLAPRGTTFLLEDATPEGLIKSMDKGHPTSGLFSSEAGIVFGSHGMASDSAMRNMATLNKFWDGDAIRVTRSDTNKNVLLTGRRLTLSLAVQASTVRTFFDGSKGLARGTGFGARFLIAWPKSTQGFRPYKEPANSFSALDTFKRKTLELINTDLVIDEKTGAIEAHTLTLSAKAKAVWITFYNDTEAELKTGGELTDIKDVTSKAGDNAARIAALFHVYEYGVTGTISEDHMTKACHLMAWYLMESRRFFGEIALPKELSNATLLDTWLIDYCKDNQLTRISTMLARQLCPNSIRSKAVYEETIKNLTELKRIRTTKEGKKKWIEVNPKLLEA